MNRKPKGRVLNDGIRGQSRAEGFTLIELLIVMLLLAALTFMGIGSYLSSQRKGRDTRRKTDVQEISRTLEMYLNDMGNYPGNDNSGRMLACSDGVSVCEWGEAWYKTEGNRATTYMQNTPKDPSAGQRYFYYKVPNKTAYLLYARLENPDDPGYDGNLTTNCGVSEILSCTYVLRSVNLTPTPTPN